MQKRTIGRIAALTLLLFILLGGLGIIYLNKVVIPIKLKSLIIQNLETLTQKKVSLGSVQFNLFKGIILTNLSLSDGQKELISVRNASCYFLILPILKEKKVFIPGITLDEPKIFLERKADNTFNLLELLPKQPAAGGKQKLSLIISRVIITKGKIDFLDNSLSPAFSQSLDELNLNASLSLPTNIQFDSQFKILTASPTTVTANGEFQIFNQHLLAKLLINNLEPQEFAPYYRALRIAITDGRVNSSIDLNLNLKDSLLNADITAQGKNLHLSQEDIQMKLSSEITSHLSYRIQDKMLNADITAQNKDVTVSKGHLHMQLDSRIKANLQYNLKNNQLHYSGTADLQKANISGIETINELQNLSAQIKFSDTKVNSENVFATVWGLPFEAKITLEDFHNPLLSLEGISQLNLAAGQKILAEKFKIALPAAITAGEGRLSLSLKTRVPLREPLQLIGSLSIQKAAIKAEKIASPFTDIQGLFEFNLNELKWPKLQFKYLGQHYTTDGALTNFKSPQVGLNLNSEKLSLRAAFTLEGPLLKISKCAGKFLNSNFSFSGDINTSDPDSLQTNILSNSEISLSDLKEIPLPALQGQLEKIQPEGLVKVKLSLNGNINQPKFCSLSASISSSFLSLYGLKTDKVLLEYTQSEGLTDIILPVFSFYDGTMEALVRINFDSENMPFRIETKIMDINIEKLKTDTPLKTQDIAGTLQSVTTLNGFMANPAQLSGAGKILIKDGKLWELNLFKGLGKIIFLKDFASIVFHKGYCEFFIKDKTIFTENLQFVNPMVEIEGRGKIGFDSAIEATLNVHLSDEFIPGTGTFKDITTMLMGQAGRFGIIGIKGTLQKPEFRYKTPKLEIIKDLTGSIIDSLFGN